MFEGCALDDVFGGVGDDCGEGDDGGGGLEDRLHDMYYSEVLGGGSDVGVGLLRECTIAVM